MDYKRVVVRIIKENSIKIRTIRQRGFCSFADYDYNFMDFVKDLKEGEEIYLKCGRTYSTFYGYEDAKADIQEYGYKDIEEAIKSYFTGICSASYYVKEYLRG